MAADLDPDPLGMRIDFGRLDPGPDPGEHKSDQKIIEEVSCFEVLGVLF